MTTFYDRSRPIEPDGVQRPSRSAPLFAFALLAILSLALFSPGCSSDSGSDGPAPSASTPTTSPPVDAGLTEAPNTAAVPTVGIGLLTDTGSNRPGVEVYSLDLAAVRGGFATGVDGPAIVTALGRLIQCGTDGADFLMVTGDVIASRTGRGITLSPTTRDIIADAGTAGPDVVDTPAAVDHDDRRGIFWLASPGESAAIGIWSGSGPEPERYLTLPFSGPPVDLKVLEGEDALLGVLASGLCEVFRNLGSLKPPAPIASDFSFELLDEGGSPVQVAAVDLTTEAMVVVTAPTQGGPDSRLLVYPVALPEGGVLSPKRVIAGPSTLLGDARDVTILGDDVYVLDARTRRLLHWSGLLSSSEAGDLAPTAGRPVTNARGLVLITEPAERPVSSDLGPTDNPSTVFFGCDDGRIVRVLAAQPSSQVSVTSIFEPVRSLVFDAEGDGHALTILNNDASHVVIDRLGSSRDPGDSTLQEGNQRDRRLLGPQFGLSEPQGTDLDPGLGLMVAETGNNRVRLYPLLGYGDTAQLAEVKNIAGVWDLDYDPKGDALYCSSETGSVVVLETFSKTFGLNRRVIEVKKPDGQDLPTPVNLRGIVHDAAGDKLYLALAGELGDTTDGALVVIENASTAVGPTSAATIITGPVNTQLGDPFDLAWDGRRLYVAERGNNLLLVFELENLPATADVPASLVGFPPANTLIRTVAVTTGDLAPVARPVR